MADFMDKNDDLDSTFICIMMSATTLLNLYAELPECCTKRKHGVWLNLRMPISIKQARLFAGGVSDPL